MDLLELLKSKDYENLNKKLSENSKQGIDDRVKEYAENDREIRDEQVGKKPTRKAVQNKDLIPNKIAVPFQRKIVHSASAFLYGNPISVVESEFDENMMKAIQNTMKDLRLDAKLLKACETCKSFLKAAILFRAAPDSTNKVVMKATLLTPDKDKFEPGFNDFGDMVLFMYETKYKNEEDKDVVRYYYYDAENFYIVDNIENKYVDVQSGKHIFDRIPVAYVDQPEPDWRFVEGLIDRYEGQLSKLGDINDYFASPVWKVTGKMDKMPEKDETGTVYKMDLVVTDKGDVIPTDMDVVSWNQSTDSIKLELETLYMLIYSLSNTPDLTFDNLKGIGNIAGVSLELMFMDVVIKQKFDETIFRTFTERVLNVMMSGMAFINKTEGFAATALEIQYNVRFNSIIPKNIQELIGMLAEGVAGKPIMSQETAVEMNPFVENPQEELEKIKADGEDELGSTQNL